MLNSSDMINAAPSTARTESVSSTSTDFPVHVIAAMVAVDLGIHLDVSSWRSYSDVVQHCLNANSSVQSSQGDEWWLTLLPRTLRSHRGIARMYLQHPEFVFLLMEALLKESVRPLIAGEAARRQLCYFTEALTTVLLSRSAMVQTQVSSLVSSAQVTLDYVDGAHRALAITTSLIFSGLVSFSSLVPVIRRRLQEVSKSTDTWTADVAAMCCMSFYDSLLQQQPSFDDESADGGAALALKEVKWTALRKRDSTPRTASSRGASPQMAQPTTPAESREGSPAGSGGFVFISKDASLNPSSISFPEKLPPSVTVASSVIMSCAIMSSTTLTLQPALTLGQWCLSALHAMPLTITACALTQLLLKFPKGFRVSTSAQDKNVRFCDAVIVNCCRIVTTLFEKRVQHGVHSCYVNSGGCRDDVDDAILSIEVMPCFLALCLQAIVCSKGLLLSAETQTHLGKLFTYVCRLYVSHYSFTEEETARAKAMHGAGAERRVRSTPSEVVEQLLRATFRAVDLVLHDYEAGSPEILRQCLVRTSAPQSSLLSKVQDCGAGLRHQDLLETITAAVDPDIDLRFAIASANAKNSKLSLAGWLPAAADPLQLGGYPWANDGGLLVKQKVWVVRRMMEYFRREWYCARVGVQATQLYEEGQPRELFLSCFPRAI